MTRGYRGWAYLEIGAVRLGLEDFEACLRENPESADFLTGRALARIRLRQRDEALADAAMAERQESLSPQLLYSLSCVYAQASALVALEARSGRDRLLVQRQAEYDARALKYLQRALEEMPSARRGKFSRDQVRTDAGLAAIRRTTTYLELASRYGRDGD